MHGAQPSPNSTPSSGAAARPTDGTWWIRQSRCIHGTTPRKTRPSRIVRLPEHDGDRALVGEQPLPHGADQRAEGDEHEREPDHEQQRPGQHPATAGVGEVGAGETGGVGEVAGQQRHHARREERDQPGDHGHRDREHAASRRERWSRTSCRGRRASRGRPVLDVAHQVDQRLLAGHARRGCWRPRDPACRSRPCSGSRSGRGCRRTRAGCDRTGRRASRRGRRSGARRRGPGRGWSPSCSPRGRRPRPWRAHATRRRGQAPPCGRAGTRSPRR